MRSERTAKIRETIHQATQALLSTISTSYGPKGLDKMLIKEGKSLVTNDGATILGFYKTHPIHRVLSNISAAQDINCGDGTTSVVLLACHLYEKMHGLLARGIHPTRIAEALETAKQLAIKHVDGIKTRVDESEFINVALTSLNSKIASKSIQMATVALSALNYADRSDIRVVKKPEGVIDDIMMSRGVVLDRKMEIEPGWYKALLVQFCISAPKTNMDSKILINDYSLVEKFVREEREYVINIIREVKKTGSNLLIIQKSLMREACSDLARHFLKKLGIAVIDNIDRKDMEYLAKMTGMKPASDVELIGSPMDMEVRRTHGMVELAGYGCSVVVTGCDQMVTDEAARALDDVFGVIGSLKKESSILPGGGAIETGIAVMLEEYTGPNSLILQEVASGFLAMPFCLAQNAGVNPVAVVSQLKKNVTLNHNVGISIRSGTLVDMVNEEKVVQPVAVARSMVIMAMEAVQMLVKIDDILPGRE